MDILVATFELLGRLVPNDALELVWQIEDFQLEVPQRECLGKC